MKDRKYMTPEEFFYHIFSPMPRQGPGCAGATGKAFSFVSGLPPDARVLDVGCGTGAPTIDIARLSGGTVTAVDNHRPFLEILRERARRAGVGGRIATVIASMDSLPFRRDAFDLIWSEGAIDIMGFQAGLAAWKPLCRKGGYIVVSDIAWFEGNPPGELLRFWEQVGCTLFSEDKKVRQVKDAGLRPVATFRLPRAGWWDCYYVPMQERVRELRETREKNPEFGEILASCEQEIEMYRKYGRYYGYTFFIMENS